MAKNVLLVDDDHVFNFLTRNIINGFGFGDKINVAMNGEEALKIIDELRGTSQLPDLILLDINMPIMNGFEFLEEFNKLSFKKKERMLIAIVTSSTEQEDIDRANLLGIKYFLSKPVRPGDISRLLEEEKVL
jgi:CheY-like chemotaxis protein